MYDVARGRQIISELLIDKCYRCVVYEARFFRTQSFFILDKIRIYACRSMGRIRNKQR